MIPACKGRARDMVGEGLATFEIVSDITRTCPPPFKIGAESGAPHCRTADIGQATRDRNWCEEHTAISKYAVGIVVEKECIEQENITIRRFILAMSDRV